MFPFVNEAINIDLKDSIINLLTDTDKTQLRDVIELMVTFDVRLLPSTAENPDSPKFEPDIRGLTTFGTKNLPMRMSTQTLIRQSY